MSSGHTKRVTTAALAVPVVLLIVFFGGHIGFTLLVALTAILATLEYDALLFQKNPVWLKVLGIIFCAVLIATFYAGAFKAVSASLVIVFLITGCLGVCRLGLNDPVHVLSKMMTGVLYVPFLLGHLVLIRQWESGITWTLFVLAVVFAGDTAAYYIGRAVGRRKLCPTISPGKTVEGAAGGLAGSITMACVFKAYWICGLSWWFAVTLGTVLGAAAQMGDLTESALKRSARIKDSGRLLPGHGGILDRIDGLLFAVPILYYVRTYLS
ncbi:MAG: phosphatidate cytidylyltransferase [Deltaproteobacteria bacterium]|nr:phosphatidate cytidylyltransferase [Deltaproteobacteria bacterium]